MMIDGDASILGISSKIPTVCFPRSTQGRRRVEAIGPCSKAVRFVPFTRLPYWLLRLNAARIGNKASGKGFLTNLKLHREKLCKASEKNRGDRMKANGQNHTNI